jgi:hypothetical protein
MINIGQADKVFDREIRKALTEIGKDNVRHLQALIKNPPKTGRWYKFKGRPHQASAPFQAPADRSGDLRKTSGYRVYGNKMEFGDRMPYGTYLEKGTSRMKPRPHLKRTVREKQRDNFMTLANTVHRGLMKP